MSREMSEEYPLYVGDPIHCKDEKDREFTQRYYYGEGILTEYADDSFDLIVTGWRRVAR